MYITTDDVENLKKGQEEAFNKFFSNYKKLLYFIIVSIVKNEQDSYDLLQDVCLKVYTKVQTLENNKTFHSWVTLMARNTALDFVKKHKREGELTDFAILNNSFKSNNNAITFNFNNYLTNFENIVVTYKIVYEFTFKEISKLLQCSKSQVFVIYKEALKKIKKHYKEENLS